MQDADVSGDTENSQDAEIEDSGRPDANLDADQELDVETADMEGDTETCVADLAPRTCETEEPVAEGILSATQSISSEDLAIELVFAGVEEHNGQLALVFDVVDECGNVLQRRMISDEETMILTINGVAYTVSADGIYDGTNPWGHLTVRVNCSLTEEQCEVAAGVINRGEELLFDGFRLRLDDIENGEDTNRAILSVLDRDGTVIDRLIITENSSEIRAYGGVGYTILVGDVAPGYGFGANWAYLTVLRNCVGE
jgi:hypothetical protein